MNFWQILRREFSYLLIKDMRRATFLLGASLAYLVLFSILYLPNVINHVPLVIYDQDQSALSRSLVQGFSDSERFQVVAQVTSQEDMRKTLNRQEALAAVDIPADFSKTILHGQSAPVLLMVNASNILIANTASMAAQDIIGHFSRHTAVDKFEAISGQPLNASAKIGPVSFHYRVIHNPAVAYHAFFIIGLAMAALQQGIFLATGAGILQEYTSDHLPRTKRRYLILGKLLPYFLTAFVAFLLSWVVAAYYYQVPVRGSFVQILLLSLSFIFAVTAFGAMVASFFDRELSFIRFSIIYTVPAFLYSGYTWPHEGMDTFSRLVAHLFPYNFFANTIRQLMLAGYAPSFWQDFLILLCMGFLFLAIFSWYYPRKLCRLDSTER